jgi:hypothetical protein
MLNQAWRPLAFAVVIAAVPVACTDQPGTGPGGVGSAGPNLGLAKGKQGTTVVTQDGENCEVIAFDGFKHRDVITPFSLFGGDVTVTPSAARPGVSDPGPRAYDSELWDWVNFPPSSSCVPANFHYDQQKNMRCPECAGRMAVVTNLCYAGTDDTFDSENEGGGTITFSFTGGPFTIPSYEAVDCDSRDRNIYLEVGNLGEGLTRIGSCETGEGGEGFGDGFVSDVTTDPVEVNDVATFTFLGSGGVDNIKVCRPPEEEGVGRMTGGGGQLTLGAVHVTRGFTIHCDITLSNNVEVNWPDNKWHLDKPLQTARCEMEGAGPEPPPAPFDTFYGTGLGRLNGSDNTSWIAFRFRDSGEPGGKADMAEIKIWAPGDPISAEPVLNVPWSVLDHGNIQAHYDQPHGSNVNK